MDSSRRTKRKGLKYMRNRRRSYKRRNGGAASWLILCLVIFAAVVTIRFFAPDLKNKVQSVMTPVYARSEQYKAVFTRFGEALSGDKSFTDVFSSLINLGKRS